MTAPEDKPGRQTIAEICSQPQCWGECFAALDQDQLPRIKKNIGQQTDWLFVGCGSSYYVALSAAAGWTALTGQRARAVPASELLLFPDLVLSGAVSYQPVLISRSGNTSEVVKAAEYLELTRNIRTLAISCATHQALETVSSSTLYLLPAAEQSTVMTRSFTSMLLALLALAADIGGQRDFAAALRRVPSLVPRVLESLPEQVRQFVDTHELADYCYLGQGPFFGLANEAMLKVKEMSCSYAQCFHTLEFRHGPKAIVSPATMIGFFLSESGYEAEAEVLQETKGLGGTTVVVTNRADSATRRAADLLVELGLDIPECARLAAYIVTGQLLGFYTGLKKGWNPDQPRNLSAFVSLNDRWQ